MLSFFSKKSIYAPTIQSASPRTRPFLQTILGDTAYAIKSVFTFAIGADSVTAVNGERCFEKDDHDYSLYSEAEDRPYDLLVKVNGIYNDGKNDCANFFVNTMHFGKSAFGADTCTLNYHITNPDSGIIKTLEENCPDGFGAVWSDYMAAAGIVAGGVLVIGCCYLCFTGGKSLRRARGLTNSAAVLAS